MKLFTVGPVEMYDEVVELRAHHDSVPYFRTDDFSSLMLENDFLLKKFSNAGEKAEIIYLTTSGTGAMEATVLNICDNNTRVLIVNGGTFGKRFEEICLIHKIPYDVIKLEYGEVLTKEHFSKIETDKYTALLVNIDETSTGQLYDIDLLSDICRKKNMYLIVDAISSFLCDKLDMRKSGVDALIIGSQKGICVSPGMAMVILSDRIINERVKKQDIKSLYFDFNRYMQDFKRGQTPFTPAVGICLEINTSLKMIDKIGLEQYILKINKLANDFREKAHSLPVKIPSYPLSNAVTPIIFEKPVAYKVFLELKNNYDVYVNPTGGEMHDYCLRISHIGKISQEDNTYLVSCIKEVYDKVMHEDKK